MLLNDRQLVFRPASRPGLPSPLTVRSTGHYRLRHAREENRPRDFTQLFWIRSGGGRFQRHDRLLRCEAGQVFHYSGGEPHSIQAGGEELDYFWITFDGRWIGKWLDERHAGPEARTAGNCPVGLFNQIRDTIVQPTLEAEERAVLLGWRLLTRFCQANRATADETAGEMQLVRALERLMEANFTDPDFGIEAAAGQLQRHRATLYRVFRQQRGMSPSAYLQRLRVRKGLDLLRSSSLPIAEIALACGFREANYFSKVIRHATGDSPRRIKARSPEGSGP